MRHVCVSLLSGTGTASIRVKDINDMPPQFTKEEWFTEVDETEGPDLPEMPILTVTVHDEDETNKFQYKVSATRAHPFIFCRYTKQDIQIEYRVSKCSITGCDSFLPTRLERHRDCVPLPRDISEEAQRSTRSVTFR